MLPWLTWRAVGPGPWSAAPQDIVTHCPNTPGTQLLYCLVKQKLQLKDRLHEMLKDASAA